MEKEERGNLIELKEEMQVLQLQRSFLSLRSPRTTLLVATRRVLSTVRLLRVPSC
jgi:hypothetical protein